ncbi:MAG: hypothetical protein LBE36_04600 [Flavobacteriaceae bacterium]|jgi:hypothetical protein|nr:hypothetical protein [Flavobacteriaceae bacterium]
MENYNAELPELKSRNSDLGSRRKKLLKKFGIGGIIFFTIKGIISSVLIYFLGKNFWEVIKGWLD